MFSSHADGALDRRGGQVAAASHSSAPGWRRRYAAVSGLVVVGVLLQSVNRQWSTDMALHTGVVRALAANPIDPTNPLVDSPTFHTFYSPYTLAVALLERWTPLSAVGALTVAGVVMAASVCAGLWWFVVEFTGDERAPLWVLLCVLLLVGPQPYRWSGFLHLGAIGFVAPYPATAATVGALVALALVCRVGGRRPDTLRWLLVPTVAWTVLVHPPTAAWMSIGIGAIVLSRRITGGVDPWRIIGPVALGAALALAWPYWRWPAALNLVEDYRVVSSRLYEHAATTLGPPIVVGVVALGSRVRTAGAALRDPAVWMLVGSVLVYAAGALFDRQQAARVLPLVLLVVSVEVGRWFARMEAAGRIMLVAIAAAALILGGLVVTRAGVVRMVPSALLPASVTSSSQWAPIVDRYDWVADVVDEGSVVLSPAQARELTFNGLREVAPSWEPNLLQDVDERRAAHSMMLAAGLSPERRTELLEAWDVAAAVVPQWQGELIADLVAAGGRVDGERDGEVLILFDR